MNNQLEWLIRLFYAYPNVSLGFLAGVSLVIAGFAFVQLRRACKVFLSKKQLLKELGEHFPPSNGT